MSLRQIRCLIPALTLLFAACGGGGGEGSVEPPVATQLPPIITTSLGDRAEVGPGRLRFEVRVDDPEGDPIRLDLLNPPAGLVFSPLRDAATPVVAEVRWDVATGPGFRSLRFRASDGTNTTDFDLRIDAAFLRASALEVGDVSGDGRSDVIGLASGADRDGVEDAGAIFVWSGLDQPSGEPSFVLESPERMAGAEFGRTSMQLVDVTGDGVLDILVKGERNISELNPEGAIYLWEGGRLGSSPTAALITPDANDGFLFPEVADVTGDGRLDVLVLAPLGRGDGYRGGAVYIWSGARGFEGQVEPAAVLFDPEAVPEDRLGNGSRTPLVLADVTGDGKLDVTVVTQSGFFGSGSTPGMTLVYEVELSQSTGTRLIAPRATLDLPAYPRSAFAVELTGDGILDLYVPPYIYDGGDTLSGEVSPRGYVEIEAPTYPEAIVYPTPSFDVDSDGNIDLVLTDPLRNLGHLPAVGDLRVWRGGQDRRGPWPHDFRLLPQTPQGNEYLGSFLVQNLYPRIEQHDVIGDERPDLIVVGTLGAQAIFPEVPLKPAIYIFDGANFEAQTRSTIVLLTSVTSPKINRFEVADFTGDGKDDVLVAGLENITIWGHLGDQTGGSPAPTARLLHPQGDLLLAEIVDLDGDGAMDILANEVENLQVTIPRIWFGGPELSGNVLPDLQLSAANPQVALHPRSSRFVDLNGDGMLDIVHFWVDEGLLWLLEPGSQGVASAVGLFRAPQTEFLGTAVGDGYLVRDVSGDGHLDLVVGDPQADVGGVIDAGAVFIWEGPLQDSPLAPRDVLSDPEALPNDRLGS